MRSGPGVCIIPSARAASAVRASRRDPCHAPLSRRPRPGRRRLFLSRLGGRARVTRLGLRRAEAVAQGHAHARGPVRPGARHPAQPLRRLPPRRPVHARVGHPELRRAGLLRRRRQRRRDLRRGGLEVAGAPLAGQGRPLDLARVVREGIARRRRSESDSRDDARRGRGHGVFHRPPHRQEGSRLSDPRAPAVRGRPLPPVRRQRHVLPQGRTGRAGDAPRLRRLRRNGQSKAKGASQDLGAPRARLAARRSHVEERQGQRPDRRAQLRGGPGCERLLLPHLQRRGRRRRRLAVRRARHEAPLRLLEARPVAGRLRPRAIARPLPPLQDAGDRDRRPAPRARARGAHDPRGSRRGSHGRGAAALLPGARGPVRPRARAQLEPRRGKHADARGAAGDGRGLLRSSTPTTTSS